MLVVMIFFRLSRSGFGLQIKEGVDGSARLGLFATAIIFSLARFAYQKFFLVAWF